LFLAGVTALSALLVLPGPDYEGIIGEELRREARCICWRYSCSWPPARSQTVLLASLFIVIAPLAKGLTLPRSEPGNVE
jgi:hypothetical protein